MNEPSKIRTFSFAADTFWEESSDNWRRQVSPVYRIPSGDWEEQPGHRKQWAWFAPELFGLDEDESPEGIAWPTWFRCYWDMQSGRWIILSDPLSTCFVKIPSGGVATAADNGVTPSVTACEVYYPTGTAGALEAVTDDEDAAVSIDIHHYGAAIGGVGDHDFQYMQADRDGGLWILRVEYCDG